MEQSKSIAYTRWPHGPKSPSGGVLVMTDWSGLFAWLSKPVTSEDKEIAGGWSPAVFTADHRLDTNVDVVTALVLDHDKGVCTLHGISEMVRAYRHIVHSTHSSREGFPRWRAVLAVSRPMSPLEHGVIWRMVAGRMKRASVVIDPSTKNSSRYWYAPCVAPGQRYEVASGDGALLDVDSLLTEAKQQEARDRAHRDSKPRSSQVPSGLRYASAALRNAADRVAGSGNGERNASLNREVWNVARFPELATHAIVDIMTEAAKYAGLRDGEIRSTIHSALKARGR